MAQPLKPDGNDSWINRLVSSMQGFFGLPQSNGGSHDSYLEDVNQEIIDNQSEDLPSHMQDLRDLLDDSEQHRKPPF